MYISPEDKAMVITFSGASLLVLIFFFITIKPFDEKQEEEFFDIPIVELPEPEPEEQEEIAQLPDNQKITHQLFNSERLQREANRFFSQEDEVREALENEAAYPAFLAACFLRWPSRFFWPLFRQKVC